MQDNSTAAIPTWEELLQLIMDAEPLRVLNCQKCGQLIHEALRYQGALITKLAFAGDDGVQCDECARALHVRTMFASGSIGSYERSAWSDEIKHWNSLRSRRVNAALKRCGIDFRVHLSRSRRKSY